METPDTTKNSGERCRVKEGGEGKNKFWCDNCPYNVESSNEAAKKKHLTTEHSDSPITRKGKNERYPKIAYVIGAKKGKNKKYPQIAYKLKFDDDKTIEEDGEDKDKDKADKNDEEYSDDDEDGDETMEEDGEDGDEDKADKNDKEYSDDDEDGDDREDKNDEEFSDPPWWSTQKNKNSNEEELEEMLNELEKGTTTEPTNSTEISNETRNTHED